MSHIGKLPLTIPAGVEIIEETGKVTVKGPKGTLTVPVPREIKLDRQDQVINVLRSDETKRVKSLHGLTRSLLANAVEGVEKGFAKKLELHGVGYRAVLEGEGLTLSLGFSHPVKINPPEGITFKTEKNTVTIEGIDKQLVGQVAAEIRSYRKPEPYKGKGIRYSGEQVRRKPGKAAKAAA